MPDFRQELLAVFTAELRDHVAAIRAILEVAAAGRAPALREALRRAHTMKGAARAVDLPGVEEAAHRLEALFAAAEAGRMALDAAAIAEAHGLVDAAERRAASPWPAAPEEEGPQPEPLPEPGPPAAQGGPTEYLRVAAGHVEDVAEAAHALGTEIGRQDAEAGVLRALQAEARHLGQHWDQMRRALRVGASGEVEFGQALQRLERHLGAALRSRVAQEWRLGQAAMQLRDAAARLSLVPASEVLGTLGRMAREVAREEGRDVAIRLEGLDVQADRRVLQALKDPVLHMLRNAIGHGVEPAATRQAVGKPAQGEVGLRLATRSGRLVVTVFDDGRGPDLQKIEAVGTARGLLPPRRPGDPPHAPDRLLGLVFEPGFSTATEVDRLSGRGMGLSVVAEAARRLRGSATLRPRRPWGAEVEIAVPFSASLQTLLLVEVAGQVLALPSHGVERLLRLPASQLQQLEGHPVARIPAGDSHVVVPVVPLSGLLERSHAELPVDAGHVQLVLLRRGERRCAIAVDRLKEVRTLAVGDLDAPGMDQALVAGGTLLDDETPALVLSPDGLVETWLRHEGRLAGTLAGLATASPVPEQTILVVDDSITTRTLERSILEAQGYRVLLAVDGVEALGVLRGGQAVVDLVIADVEMPRMDGFALLQAMKTDPRLAPIPVILMTSRADPADVRRGLELGAGAYVTKQKFDQRDLLATIGQLL